MQKTQKNEKSAKNTKKWKNANNVKKYSLDFAIALVCNCCLNLGENVYAHTHKEIIDESDPSQDEYALIKIPSSEEHVCVPSGDNLSKLAMLQAVEVDPTRPIPQIYGPKD